MSAPRVPALFVASDGGHVVQICRIARALPAAQVESSVLVTAGAIPANAPAFRLIEQCADWSRENPWRAVLSAWEWWRLLGRIAPGVVVTTGAAPGLVAVACARLRGIPALWIDSVANARRLSLSGRIARLIGVRVASQWPDVAERSGVDHAGSVL